jgi:hypothetical protein
MGRRIGFLGLVNYKKHPSDKNYYIFNFYSQEESDLFEELLTKENCWFEKDVSVLEKKEETIYLFGIEDNDFRKAEQANFMVYAKYRKHLIPNKIARWSFILLFLAIVTMAIVGYVKNS